MNNIIKLLLILFLFGGCSAFQKQEVNSNKTYKTDSGFSFRFTMPTTFMSYKGAVCLHPKRKYNFILIGISHRSQRGRLKDLSNNVKSLLSTLEFI